MSRTYTDPVTGELLGHRCACGQFNREIETRCTNCSHPLLWSVSKRIDKIDKRLDAMAMRLEKANKKIENTVTAIDATVEKLLAENKDLRWRLEELEIKHSQ